MKVTVPSLSDQRSAIRKAARAFAWIDRIALETISARKLVDHLDQAILTKAFRGELVPQDPNDEPANVLLERIKRNGKFGYQRGRRSRRNERSSCETPLAPLALERLIWLLKAVEIGGQLCLSP